MAKYDYSLGMRYGLLTIVSRDGAYAICTCDCGSENVRVLVYNLGSGHTQGCGCRRGGLTKRYLPGNRFGYLVIMAPYSDDKRYVLCDCDCGSIDVKVWKYHLGSGGTQSCGCLRGEQNKLRQTHGDSRRGKYKRLYNIWMGMLARGRDTKSPSYMQITVCKSWDDYAVFKVWALGHGYTDTLTIDRKNNKMGYCPENCRWATYLQQANNRGPRRDNTSGFKNVYYDARANTNPWSAVYTYKYEQYHVGSFATAELANAALMKHKQMTGAPL